LKNFEPEIENLILIPSDGGRFEIMLGNTLIYSKLHTGRHADPGEIVGLMEKYLKK